jgi:hypothetical protein
MKKAIVKGKISRVVSCAPLVPLALTLGACSAEVSPDESVGSSESALYFPGTKWPARTIPVCFKTNTLTAAEFALWSQVTKVAAEATWGQATGLYFSGWNACSGIGAGTIRVQLQKVGGSFTYRLGYSSVAPTDVDINVTSPRVPTDAAHEFGHALGFSHEMQRPDFVDDASGACREADILGGNALNTPPDRQSIMASTYCQLNPVLSAWDVVGSQTLYGRANYFADVTGDGRADMLIVTSTGIQARLSESNFAAPNSNWTNVAYFGQKGTHFADVNGDHRADAIVVNDSGIVVRTSNGSSFPAANQKAWTEAVFYGYRGTFFADVTGDGAADAIAVNDDGIFVRPSSGSSFPAAGQTRWTTAFFGERGTYFADVSGDGRADAIVVNADGITVRFSTGFSFGTPFKLTAGEYFGERGTFFADVTGDGRADAIVVNNGGTTVRPYDGVAFAANQDWILGGYYGQRGTFFADLNGGGRADAIAVNDDGVFYRRSNGMAFVTPVLNLTGGAFYSPN